MTASARVRFRARFTPYSPRIYLLTTSRSTSMFMFFAYVVIGAVGGHVLAVVARRSPDRTGQLFAHALVIATFVYVAFAMASMESAWLVIEIAGLLIFLVFASLGLKRSLSWLWLGWALHMVWDAGIHMLVETAFVPAWYPALCIGFDAVVAYHVYRMQAALKQSAGAVA